MIKHEIKKITHYEYWSFWVFYIPMIPIYLWMSLRARSLLYFTSTNPGLEHGGLFNYSKFNLQEQIPLKNRPEHQFIDQDSREEFKIKFDFPFIAKPNYGERGKHVDIIENQKQLDSYLKYNLKDILFQEYIDFPLELGLFYARFPYEDQGKIISITAKKFLHFVGDGKTSLREFIESDSRAYFNKSYLYMKFHDKQELVLPEGEKIILEEIGNHNRGTYFYDGSNLNSPILEQKLNEVLKPIDGFYFGRVDIKTPSLEELEQGNFKILEINGSNSEATHVFDENYSLIDAYKEVYKHLKIQHKIALANIKTGHKPEKLKHFIPILIKFLFQS